jgi:hypothetical protein
MEIIFDSVYAVRTLEWFIPWSQIAGLKDSFPAGTKFGFNILYTDADTGFSSCYNSLVWQGQCDPYCGPDVKYWGNIEIEQTIIKTRNPFHNPISSHNSFSSNAEFYTIRGEKISSSSFTKTKSLVVKRDGLAKSRLLPGMLEMSH